jgi:hypothetical protein
MKRCLAPVVHFSAAIAAGTTARWPLIWSRTQRAVSHPWVRPTAL